MNFKWQANAVYKNDEKLELAKLIEKYEKQNDEKVEKNHGKRKYDYRRKRHVAVKPKWFLFESSAGVLHWHKRCPKCSSRFSRSYQSSNTCNWKHSRPVKPCITSCKESACFWWWQKTQSSGNSFGIIFLVC